MVLIAAISSACSTESQPQPSVSANTGTTSATPTAAQSTAPGRYAVAEDLCQEADLSALRSVLPHSEQLRAQPLPMTGQVRFECQGQMGTSDKYQDTGGFGVYATIYTKLEAPKIDFEGFKDARARYATITDLPGLGQGAYRYYDKLIGQWFVVFDGNAIFEIRWGPRIKTDPLPTGTEAALLESLTATMRKLRTGDL